MTTTQGSGTLPRMDTLTHALSGALLARATAPRNAQPGSVARRVAAGFLACAAPDLDFVVAFFGPVPYLLHHRGVTHSFLLLPLWALIYAWILAKLLREPGGWRALYGVTALGLGLHIAGDLITSFGTMILAPISDWRAQIGTTFIIDLWFSGIILVGLIGSAVFTRSRWPAVAASVLLPAYIGFQYLQKEKATAFGESYARALGLPNAVVNAQPRPVSPFNWTVFVSNADAHRFADVNLVRRNVIELKPGDSFIERLDAAYLPLSQAHWQIRSRYGEGELEPVARDAWNSPAMDPFRWFAALPAFDGASSDPTCVWFADLRFLTPGREALPFRYGACRDHAEKPWRLVPP
jgi:inner membrane protein